MVLLGASQQAIVAGVRVSWQRLLDATGGNISEAARRGGIHRKSLEYIVKKLDLRGS